MPRKKPTELKSAAPAEAPAIETNPVEPAPIAAPITAVAQTAAYHPADLNGDGHSRC